jgi:hypothetical protein
LAEALRERLAVIADRAAYEQDPAAHLTRLQSASERIDRAAAALPRPVPGDLAHFLKGSSYQKALAWLDAHIAA